MAKKTKRSKRKAITLPRAVKRAFPQVTKAVDSDDYIEVNVLQKDCDSAVAGNPAECAMARAFRREYDADGAIIGITSSYIIKGRTAIRYETPEHVKRELVSFDRHHDFEPGEYSLRPKRPAARLGYKPKEGPYATGPDKRVRRKIYHTARVRALEAGSE